MEANKVKPDVHLTITMYDTDGYDDERSIHEETSIEDENKKKRNAIALEGMVIESLWICTESNPDMSPQMVSLHKMLVMELTTSQQCMVVVRSFDRNMQWYEESRYGLIIFIMNKSMRISRCIMQTISLWLGKLLMDYIICDDRGMGIVYDASRLQEYDKNHGTTKTVAGSARMDTEWTSSKAQDKVGCDGICETLMHNAIKTSCNIALIIGPKELNVSGESGNTSCSNGNHRNMMKVYESINNVSLLRSIDEDSHNLYATLANRRPVGKAESVWEKSDKSSMERFI